MPDPDLSQAQSVHENSKMDLTHVPSWFAAGFGAVYLTGYMIQFLFFSLIGVRETGADVFKLQYTYTGFLFFLLTLIFSIPFYFQFLARDQVTRDLQTKLSGKLVRLSTLIAMMFVLFLYSVVFLILFSRPEDYQSISTSITAVILIAVPMLGYVTGVIYLERRQEHLKEGVTDGVQLSRITKEFEHQWHILIWAILIIIIVCDVILGLETRIGRTIVNCFVSHFGFLFYATLALATFLLWRTITRSAQMRHGIGFVAFWSLMICSMVVMYFVSIVLFAYTIYPFMPEIKGGGDYTDTGTYTVDLPEFHDQNFVLLYQGVDVAYLARIEVGNGPQEWRVRQAYPRIVRISRRKLEVLLYEPPSSLNITKGIAGP